MLRPLHQLACIFLAALAIVRVLSATARAIQVSVATDQSTYIVGDPIVYSVIASNPTFTPVTLQFNTSLQADYTVDGIYSPGDNGLDVLTSRLVPAHASVSWDFLHPWSLYSMAPGPHFVTGEVVGYATSLPATFSISSPAPVTHDVLLDFEHYPNGAPTHDGNQLTYGLWRDAFIRDGVHFHSQGGGVTLSLGNQGALLDTPSTSYPPGFNIVADFDMPVYDVSAEVGSAANCTITMIASGANGQVLGSVTSGPVTDYPNLIGPLSFDSTVPIASVQWFSSLQNASVRIDNLFLNVDLAETHGDYNADGRTDAADYTLWRDAMGTAVPIGLGADGNHNGIIDSGDYDIWKSNFGNHSGSGASATAAVPEPTTLFMLLVGIVTICASRQQKCRKLMRP